MKNREKYKDELLDLFLARRDIGVRSFDHVPCDCRDIECANCMLREEGKFCKSLSDWTEEEYVPYADWSKVEVNTPIWVTDMGFTSENEGVKRCFAKFEDGKIYAWDNGGVSWTKKDSEITSWNYARLAEEGEQKNGYNTF